MTKSTARAVAEVADRYPRVHLALLPHTGPTSKGDCLNWIYHRMVEHEIEHGIRFEIIVTHDAEDLMHAESLRLISWFSRDHEMVQIPVLALATPVWQLTHGLYCDEFAEYQLKDIPVRLRLGGFLPSNGVGCGFARTALERLAETREGRIFDPECLTEDYENGFRLHAMGYRQIFVPVRLDGRASGNARILSAGLKGGCPAAQPLGCGHRFTRLAASWMACAAAPTLLVLARPEVFGWQFALAAWQRRVSRGLARFPLVPRRAALACGCVYGAALGFAVPYCHASVLLLADIRPPLRCRRTCSDTVRKCGELRHDLYCPLGVPVRPRQAPRAGLAQDGAFLPGASNDGRRRAAPG